MVEANLSALLQQIHWNEQGLVPAVAIQYDTQEVLMLAWMNAESLTETINNQHVCYWSRSRQSLWRKGESSGQTQQLHSLRLDCDGDTLLVEVDQKGPACHTGRRSCFYRRWDQEQKKWMTESEPLIHPDELYPN